MLVELPVDLVGVGPVREVTGPVHHQPARRHNLGDDSAAGVVSLVAPAHDHQYRDGDAGQTLEHQAVGLLGDAADRGVNGFCLVKPQEWA
ncbi:MAG TPA: hypothetical protein VFV32_03165 [Acidimicrobiales bacterium]|nr:hypothetical protein [Acidimicrobiales bacterium]